jgi:Nif-specific regulatory protein
VWILKRKGFSGEENLLKVNVEEFEKHIIVSALARTRGNQSLAAKQLGTTKRVIAYRIRKYNIGLEQYYDKTSNKHK